MSNRNKEILGLVLGLAVAMASFILFQFIAHYAYPLPVGVDPDSTESMKEYMPHIPFGSLSLLLSGWIMGSLFAGYFAKYVSNDESYRNPLIIGCLLESATIFNFMLLPYPVWFIAISLIIIMPAVFVGNGLIKASK